MQKKKFQQDLAAALSLDPTVKDQELLSEQEDKLHL
jgi:hypothetical protein